MALKLFRSTGYSSILAPGETQLAMHPEWMVLAVSLWVGFVCNVAIWRGLRGSASLTHALVVGAAVAAASLVILSVFGWRKTMKPAAVIVLLLAALASSSIWSEAWPVDASLLQRPASTLFVPPWQSFLRLQVWLALGGLALLPAIWVTQTPVRRLSAGQLFRANVIGAAAGVMALATAMWLLEQGF